MLAKYWRLRVLNSTDNTLTYNDGARINVRASPWKISSGNLTYGTTITDDMGLVADGSIAAAGELEGDVQDNTSNLYWGINGFFEVIADLTSTDGTVYLYLEESDDNTNWPSDGADFDITKHMRLVAALALSTDAVDEDASVNFVI
jgi:hypothetical protein